MLALRARARVSRWPRALIRPLVLAFFPGVLLQFYFIFDQFDPTFDKNNHENGAKLVKMFCEWLFF